MIEIDFNAFSFLQSKLKRMNVAYADAKMLLPDGMTIQSLIRQVGLQVSDVEGVFVNGKIVPMASVLKNDDRVALVPPGTPGPYRVMLGMAKLEARASHKS